MLRALREALPNESFIYVADSQHAPYGERPRDFLEDRAQAVVGFLARQKVKAVVLACNTVSIAAAAALRAGHEVPIVAMEPAIKPAAASTKSGTVLVLATPYTVQSEAVDRLCRTFGQGVRIVLQACPGLAEQVESGQLSAPLTYDLLNGYLRPGLAAGADTIVLGCTHYAFLKPAIADLAGPAVNIIEPSDAVARQLQFRLQSARAPDGRFPGSAAFYTSGCADQLRRFLDMVGEQAGAVLNLPNPS